MVLRVWTAGQLVDAKITTAPSHEMGELALAAAREAAPFGDLTHGRGEPTMRKPAVDECSDGMDSSRDSRGIDVPESPDAPK